MSSAVEEMVLALIVMILVALTVAAFNRTERDALDKGRCEGRGGEWIAEYGCVHPPVPLEATP